MPQDTRTRRLTPPPVGGLSLTPTGPEERTSLVLSLLAGTSGLTDVLPHLHQHALEVTGGTCSLLFEHNSRNGAMQATSGFGLEGLHADPWRPDPQEARLVTDAFGRRTASLIADADRQAPDLASRLGTRSAVLLPLERGTERLGILAIGFSDPPSAITLRGDWTAVAAAFVTALELFRLRQRDELRHELRELVDEFSGTLSATVDLVTGLDLFCPSASRLFSADRASVWIHDRRPRQLVLRASSDPRQMVRGARVSIDSEWPAAVAMRGGRSQIISGSEDEATSTLVVPLRGYQRALGAMVFDGVRSETSSELDLLERADELGRQVSRAIETMQLLDDVARSRSELENTFDSIAHLVAVSDRLGRLVHVNEAFASRLSRSREDLLDHPIGECIGPELAAWLAAHEAAPRPHGPVPASREVIDPVLKGPFIVTVTDLLNQQGERVGSVVVARDLTPQTQLEAEREALRKRLTQSEKLAALGQLVAGIAHELNNPLQGVLGHLELLRATGTFPKGFRKQMQTIYREADRAAKIVRNLLVFAGSRRLAPRSVRLNAVLQKVVALRAAACRACDIEVVRHYDEQVPSVQSDPLLLHQAFLNIVMNAEQAVVATGRAGRIEITTSAQGDRIVTTVRDSGGGIPAEALSRIFEPFYTTKEVGQGTGLGLAIAYGIVQEHGGDIVAANHPEGGAIFTVNLPAKQSSRR